MNRTFGGADDATLAPVTQPSGPVERSSTLPIGTVLAERYQIIDVLGIGGMGAVYRAFDRKLTRVVALKTILPELAATPSSLKRFKQEVLSAQSIVHRNVVRIFDIGEDAATTFITMDFIEGVDLKSLIKKKGKLPVAEAAAIIRQVCEGLEAAHAAGVVHRDLKPQNIMIENDGHVVVMDFGLAHSDQSREATQTGMFIGTPDYMSPEQAKAETMDLRSDIFSLGLICYELMTGKLPYAGKTVVETMYKRTTERAVPPAEIEQSVSKDANDIIVKCLQIDREQRYQSVTQILEDLETLDPTKKVGTAALLGARLKREAPYRKIAGAVALAAVALLGGLLLRNRDVGPAQPAEAPAPVTLFIADFSNHTGDTLFDSTLEPVFKLALEDAGFITAFDRQQMRFLGLKPATGRIDDLAAQQIAVSQGLGAVVSGSLDLEGDMVVISVRAIEAVTGKSIASVDARAKKDQVLFETTKLASAIRKALGDNTSDSAQRFARETLTATSLEAIHEYALAMEEVSNGDHPKALALFSKAAELDPNFGMAYTGMANMSRNLGRLEDAEKYSNLALQKIDRMTEREKLRTRGSYYLVKGNQQKCIEEYSELVRRFPSDAAAHNNLAVCSEQLRQLPKAIDEARLAAAILPKKALYRNNLSLYASYGSDFETGEREARTVQEMDAAYQTGYIALAFAQLGQGKVSEAADTFRKLGAMDKLGASKAASGLADLAIYEGRFRAAAEILTTAAAADLAAKNSDNAATKLVALAHAHLLRGDNRAAIMAAESALESSKIVKVRFLAGRILAATGQTRRAQEMADDLAMRLENEPQAYAKMIEGEIALQKGDSRLAIKAFNEANGMAELWIGHFQLGRAYLEAGAFTEADSEFDRCMKRRGEALALFVDESPTYGYYPQVLYYLGRARQGLKSAGFKELYGNYLSIREKSGEDPLITDIKKRLSQK